MSFPVEYLNYNLPQSAIAQSGVEPRDCAKMLVVHRDKYSPNANPEVYIEHRLVKDLPEYINSNDVLIRNRSSVVKARLIVTRLPGYGKGEVFVLKVGDNGEADCLLRNFGKTCIGKKFLAGEFTGEVLCETETDSVFHVKIIKDNQPANITELLELHGVTPLPPYIHNTKVDHQRYDTVYSKEKGSVAAPTAGLHFTPELDILVQEKGASIKELILHVGLGTFKSVTVDDLSKHTMHHEDVLIPHEIIDIVSSRNKRIIAVGTTTVRSLETPFRNFRINSNGDLFGSTNCFIYPPYRFRNIDALMTNFHLPRSTLLALVMAFAGEKKERAGESDIQQGIDMVHRVYIVALSMGYRFFSLGDATLWL